MYREVTPLQLGTFSTIHWPNQRIALTARGYRDAFPSFCDGSFDGRGNKWTYSRRKTSNAARRDKIKKGLTFLRFIFFN